MAITPEAVIQEVMDAEIEGDYDTIEDLYETDAVMAVSMMGTVARGRAQIRAAMKQIHESFHVLGYEIKDHPITTVDDNAFGTVTMEVRMKVSGSDQEQAVTLTTKEVFHRSTDGKWRYLIDLS